MNVLICRLASFNMVTWSWSQNWILMEVLAFMNKYVRSLHFSYLISLSVK